MAARVPTPNTIFFEAPIRRLGRWTIVRLPENASTSLPSRGQVAVKGSINKKPFQTVLEPDGSRGHWLKLDEELERRIAAKEGETATVEIEACKEWPEPVIPNDLQAALTHASDISTLWREITPMARWEWVRWINEAKNPQTRQRRVEVSISKLRSGKRRPCCFDLTACTDPELAKNGRLVDVA